MILETPKNDAVADRADKFSWNKNNCGLFSEKEFKEQVPSIKNIFKQLLNLKKKIYHTSKNAKFKEKLRDSKNTLEIERQIAGSDIRSDNFEVKQIHLHRLQTTKSYLLRGLPPGNKFRIEVSDGRVLLHDLLHSMLNIKKAGLQNSELANCRGPSLIDITVEEKSLYLYTTGLYELLFRFSGEYLFPIFVRGDQFHTNRETLVGKISNFEQEIDKWWNAVPRLDDGNHYDYSPLVDLSSIIVNIYEAFELPRSPKIPEIPINRTVLFRIFGGNLPDSLVESASRSWHSGICTSWTNDLAVCIYFMNLGVHPDEAGGVNLFMAKDYDPGTTACVAAVSEFPSEKEVLVKPLSKFDNILIIKLKSDQEIIDFCDRELNGFENGKLREATPSGHFPPEIEMAYNTFPNPEFFPQKSYTEALTEILNKQNVNHINIIKVYITDNPTLREIWPITLVQGGGSIKRKTKKKNKRKKKTKNNRRKKRKTKRKKKTKKTKRKY